MRTIERQLDKFYTHPDVAAKCLRVFEKVSGLTLNDASCIVEPSAGNGSFLNHLPSHTIGLDISPEHPAVKRQNFFTYKRKRPAIVLGNPPFGKTHTSLSDFSTMPPALPNGSVSSYHAVLRKHQFKTVWIQTFICAILCPWTHKASCFKIHLTACPVSFKSGKKPPPHEAKF